MNSSQSPTPEWNAPEPSAPKPPAWPMVLGIIAIVFGSLGAFGGCMSAVMTLFAEKLGELMPPGQEAAFAALEKYHDLLMTTYAIAFVLAIVLLIGGIGLVRRRSWAIPVCITWAVLKIGYAMFGAYVNYLNSEAQFQATQEQLQSDPNIPNISFPDWVVEAASTIAAVFGLLWGWALPVFLLVWFSRSAVREHIRTWRTEYE
ncbi:MAG: hypothetical protein GY715_06890 [Planctomycetes bacterium]|nr:hypothetical protein [Planctomycetota bacterium]